MEKKKKMRDFRLCPNERESDTFTFVRRVAAAEEDDVAQMAKIAFCSQRVAI